LQAVVFVFPLHVVVFPFSANNNNTSNNNTPPPKPGTPSSNEGNNLTELKPVQPTPQSYTPLPSFTGQFSSKHDCLLKRGKRQHAEEKQTQQLAKQIR
jgi:hypothetical protein